VVVLAAAVVFAVAAVFVVAPVAALTLAAETGVDDAAGVAPPSRAQLKARTPTSIVHTVVFIDLASD
jgi:hypothetical protein